MRPLLICGMIVCLVALAATTALGAAPQGPAVRARTGWANGSKGAWHTGEITEPEYATRWGYGATDQGHINVISADKSIRQVGASSIKLYTETGFDTWVYFPNTTDLDLDCAQVGSISFLLHTENKNGWGGDIWVIARDMDDRAVTYRSLHNRLHLTLTQWVPYAVPVGPEVARPEIVAAYGWKAEVDKGFDWSRLACVEVHADTGGYGFNLYLDDMRFNARGAEPVAWWLSSLDKPDLTATYAERLPRYPRYALDYSQTYPLIRPDGQNAKHWPDEGEAVQWLVHVRNEGVRPSPASDLVCTVDGKAIFRTALKPMKAKTETTVAVPWKWASGAHQLVVMLDTPGDIDEITKLNNTLALQTNAYTLFAVVEKACAAKVAQVTNRYGSFSFEDWLRGSTVDHMNRMMANSTYDFAPNGAPCRVRIDKIVYVDNIKQMPQSEKPGEEIDGGWYYPEGSWIEYCNLARTYMWALDHELTHQLGIVDDYQMNLSAEHNKVNGKPFSQPDGGSMGGGRTYGRGRDRGYYADIDVAGFIATYGHRRGYFGEYLWCVPDENTVQVFAGDQPLRNADISVYQKKWDEGHGRDTTGNGTIPDTPIMQGTTDGEGRYTFENRPVLEEYTTETGCTLKPNPFGYIDVVARNGLLMLRANVGGKWYYGFMDVGLFNVEYARGHKEHGWYKLTLLPEQEPAKQ